MESAEEGYRERLVRAVCGWQWRRSVRCSVRCSSYRQCNGVKILLSSVVSHGTGHRNALSRRIKDQRSGDE